MVNSIIIKIANGEAAIKPIVCELGCGTGSVTELLAAKGFDMIGVDASQEMLRIACEKRARSGKDILYLNQLPYFYPFYPPFALQRTYQLNLESAFLSNFLALMLRRRCCL